MTSRCGCKANCSVTVCLDVASLWQDASLLLRKSITIVHLLDRETEVVLKVAGLNDTLIVKEDGAYKGDICCRDNRDYAAHRKHRVVLVDETSEAPRDKDSQNKAHSDVKASTVVNHLVNECLVGYYLWK